MLLSVESMVRTQSRGLQRASIPQSSGNSLQLPELAETLGFFRRVPYLKWHEGKCCLPDFRAISSSQLLSNGSPKSDPWELVASPWDRQKGIRFFQDLRTAQNHSGRASWVLQGGYSLEKREFMLSHGAFSTKG